MKRCLTIILAVAAALPVQAAPEKRSPAVTALAACRAISEDAGRLACFDKQAAAIDDAEKRGDLFVADREEVQKTKRTLFGLNLPSFSLFGKREGQPEEPEVKQIEGTLAGANYSDLKWTFILSDGARWRQTEVQSMLGPRAGDKVLIRRGTLGSYFFKVNNEPSVRAQRIN